MNKPVNLINFTEMEVKPPTRTEMLLSLAWIAGIVDALLFVILCLRLIARVG